ncbi:hypothetical protein KPSA1_02172 [Pseudomonas syringae pv. actinidiae]|uniref:Uncharacterized protein n=1 Tax=Pseudomonas syringae pv. actinidiae TaxID=103796 RepID=A0A2V0Q7Z4_PSESF|nr:hypothetical protein KPSA1_02172 [Pseudomonas syringae pv. actinidiae]
MILLPATLSPSPLWCCSSDATRASSTTQLTHLIQVTQLTILLPATLSPVPLWVWLTVVTVEVATEAALALISLIKVETA